MTYDATFFERLLAVEDRSFWFRARNRLIADVVRRWFPEARSLLEVGCGTGFVLKGLRESLPELRLVGVDLFEEGLVVARRRLPGDVELIRADAKELPFTAEFDVVAALDVLEHVDDDVAVLAAMYSAARRGGGLLVLVPQHPRLWSKADEAARHVRRYRRRELIERVRGAGFEVLHVSSFVSTLTPAAVASRILRRREYDLFAELVPPWPLNAVFERLLNLERALVLRRASFPFGTSLLAVARRP